MAIIRPSADLRNKYKEISELCKTTGQPVYITVNGIEDTAIIDSNVLNELYQTIKLMQEINQGIADVNSGRVMSLVDVKNRLLWHINHQYEGTGLYQGRKRKIIKTIKHL